MLFFRVLIMVWFFVFFCRGRLGPQGRGEPETFESHDKIPLSGHGWVCSLGCWLRWLVTWPGSWLLPRPSGANRWRRTFARCSPALVTFRAWWVCSQGSSGPAARWFVCSSRWSSQVTQTSRGGNIHRQDLVFDAAGCGGERWQ